MGRNRRRCWPTRQCVAASGMWQTMDSERTQRRVFVAALVCCAFLAGMVPARVHAANKGRVLGAIGAPGHLTPQRAKSITKTCKKLARHELRLAKQPTHKQQRTRDKITNLSTHLKAELDKLDQTQLGHLLDHLASHDKALRPALSHIAHDRLPSAVKQVRTESLPKLFQALDANDSKRVQPVLKKRLEGLVFDKQLDLAASLFPGEALARERIGAAVSLLATKFVPTGSVFWPRQEFRTSSEVTHRLAAWISSVIVKGEKNPFLYWALGGPKLPEVYDGVHDLDPRSLIRAGRRTKVPTREDDKFDFIHPNVLNRAYLQEIR